MQLPPRLLIGSRSAGKLRELIPLFATERIELVTPADLEIREVPEEASIESFDSFEENAVAKARWFHALTGLPTVADDSGLEVFSLGGKPGVRSKRWSGRDDLSGQALDDANNARLLSALAAHADRSARYVCVAAYVDGARELIARGETAGEITTEARGIHGFGYDPYFLSADLGQTFGEAARAAKEEVSHRGRAFRAVLAALRATP